MGPRNRSFLLTPPGAGAIAVIRVTGARACARVARALNSKSGVGLPPLEENRLRYGRLRDGDEVVDDVIASCTTVGGAAVVDICSHGGVRVVERILEALDRIGFPLAEESASPPAIWPGANLIEREALQAVGKAKTKRAVRFLAWQRHHLVPTLETLSCQARTDRDSTAQALAAMIERRSAADVLIDGASVAIVGPPNSGKSTLFNCLAGKTAALVSERAGTTRDWVSRTMEMEGVALTLIDTAGARASASGVERVAIETGTRVASQVDVKLLVLDGSVACSAEDIAPWTGLLASRRRVVIVATKLDLGTAWDEPPLPTHRSTRRPPLVRVCAPTNTGASLLLTEVLGLLELHEWVDNIACLFTDRQVLVARQVQAALRRDWRAAQRILRKRMIMP
ncbi:MAG: GTPase [Phycisphaerae bacterium]